MVKGVPALTQAHWPCGICHTLTLSVPYKTMFAATTSKTSSFFPHLGADACVEVRRATAALDFLYSPSVERSWLLCHICVIASFLLSSCHNPGMCLSVLEIPLMLYRDRSIFSFLTLPVFVPL